MSNGSVGVELGPELFQLGRVVGLLSKESTAKKPVMVEDWFQNPLSDKGLGGVPSRIEELLQLLQSVGFLGKELPPAGGVTPGKPTGSLWYPILDPTPPAAGAALVPAKPTGLYVTLNLTDKSKQVVGVGFRHDFSNVTATKNLVNKPPNVVAAAVASPAGGKTVTPGVSQPPVVGSVPLSIPGSKTAVTGAVPAPVTGVNQTPSLASNPAANQVSVGPVIDLPLFSFDNSPTNTKGTPAFVTGHKDYPVKVSVEVSAAERLQNNGFGLKSLRFGAKLSESPDVDFSLNGLGLPNWPDATLKFPGVTDAGVLNLQAIKEIPERPEEWFEFLFTFLTYQLGESARNSIMDLRYLLGLASPTAKNREFLTPPPWGSLFNDPTGEVGKWFGNSIAPDPVKLKAWLHGWFCLAQGRNIDDEQPNLNSNVIGSGTKADPYCIAVLTVPGTVQVMASVAVVGKQIFLGLRVDSYGLKLVNGMAVYLSAKADLATLTPDANSGKLTVAFSAPSFEMLMSVRNPERSIPLFRENADPDPSNHFQVGAIELAVKFDTSAVKPRFQIKALQLGTQPAKDYLLPELFGGSDNSGQQLLVKLLANGAKRAYENYQPIPESSPAEFVRKYLFLRKFNLFAQFLADFAGITEKPDQDPFISLIDSLQQELEKSDLKTLPSRTESWLLGRVKNTAGMTKAFGGLLSKLHPKFSVKNNLIQFMPFQGLSILVGVNEKNLFGLWVNPTIAVDWLKFGLTVGIGFKSDFSQMNDPQFSLRGAISTDPVRLNLPGLFQPLALVGELTGLNSPFTLKVFPRNESADEPGIEFLPNLPDNWLEQLATQLVMPVAADVILNNPAIQKLLTKQFDEKPSTPPNKPAATTPPAATIPPPTNTPGTANKPAATTATANTPAVATGTPAPAGTPVANIVPVPPLVVIPKYLTNEVSLRGILIESKLATYNDQNSTLQLNSFQKLKSQTPESILQAAFTVLLKAERFEIIPGNLAIVKRTQGDQTVYGFQVTIPDLVVTGANTPKPVAPNSVDGKPVVASPPKPAAPPTRPSTAPSVKLQVGKWLGKESDAKNWYTNSNKPVSSPIPASSKAVPQKPGLNLYLVSTTGEFAPSFELISVGVDIEGAVGKPLFDQNGYQLQGLQSRLSLAWEPNRPIKVGAAIQLTNIGIPLGPSSGASTNPVASNLLGSSPAKTSAAKPAAGGTPAGGTEIKSADAAKAAPVNPTFSGVIAYSDQFYGKIFSEEPSADGKVWLKVQRSFGPLYCRKLGLGFADPPPASGPRLLVGYDGSVALGPLGIDLIELSVGIPLKTPQNLSDYQFGLGGLDLTFDGGPVEISGSFLESKFEGNPQYTGAAMIKTKAFSIAGLGSYAVVNGDPSLFVFAVLEKELGGPSFFFVTALAAGFGFKRKLNLPSIDQVADFPLVKVIMDPDYIGKSADPKAALAKINSAIPPDPQSYWLAVGIRFRSFEMIETVALLTVSFGTEVVISILGLSRLTIPSKLEEGQPPLCYAELALRAELNPAVGVLSVQAQLTTNSYIFEPACKLTGGFAFFTWFKGPHEGDFVVTLGGYHPKFVKPSHYPIVPRVGINWPITPELRISGELYFALTPSCLMAGGKLSATYNAGWLQAWFVAYADFLIGWKPFHYDIAMGISIGGKAIIDIELATITISFSIGADVKIWGPPFAGIAKVDLSIISFEIPFGDQSPAAPKPLEWSEFSTSFLPPSESVCGTVFTGGLLNDYKPSENSNPISIVNGYELAFDVQSRVPCTTVGWKNQASAKASVASANPVLGIAPMHLSGLESPLTVELTGPQGMVDPKTVFTTAVVSKGFPKAMWGAGKPDLSTPPAKMLTRTPAGMTFVLSEEGKRKAVLHSLPIMKLEDFKYERIPKNIPWGTTQAPQPIKALPADQNMANLLWSSTENNALRDAVLDLLAQVTPYPLNTVWLPETSARAGTIYQAEPTYAALGQPLPEEK